MTEQEQRIAIAEACGWTNIKTDAGGAVLLGRSPDGQRDQLVPDYPNDLNAMHNAVMALSNTRFHKWKQELSLMIVGTKHMPPTRSFLLATASQRAEAFLRAFNLWKD